MVLSDLSIGAGWWVLLNDRILAEQIKNATAQTPKNTPSRTTTPEGDPHSKFTAKIASTIHAIIDSGNVMAITAPTPLPTQPCHVEGQANNSSATSTTLPTMRRARNPPSNTRATLVMASSAVPARSQDP